MSDRKQLPDGWKLVSFGDVAREVSASTRNPIEEGFERYVGLDHLDPDSLSIKRWGLIEEDNTTFTKVFREGQLLFGRRRSYQRKAAVADFDGICSGDIIVMEAKPEHLLPELLPFVVQSDGFFDYAIQTSAGSLSPRTKWSYLAKYQFPLLPLDEQRRIAEILWAVEDSINQHQIVLDSLIRLEKTHIRYFLHDGSYHHEQHNESEIGIIPANWQYVPCNELFVEVPRNGLSPQINPYGIGYPTVSISAVRDGEIDFENNLKFAEISDTEAQQFRIRQDDILVVRGNGNKMLVGRCGIVVSDPPDGCFYPDLLIRIRFDETRIRPKFAALLWNVEAFHSQLRRRAKSSNGIWKINGSDLRKHKILVPPLDEQDDFLQQFAKFQNNREKHQANVNQLRLLKCRLIDELLLLKGHLNDV